LGKSLVVRDSQPHSARLGDLKAYSVPQGIKNLNPKTYRNKPQCVGLNHRDTIYTATFKD